MNMKKMNLKRIGLWLALALCATLSLCLLAGCVTAPDAPETDPVTTAGGTPTAEPTAVPEAAPAFPCQGKDGACTFVTRQEDDPFCRFCDFNDNGVEDSKE